MKQPLFKNIKIIHKLIILITVSIVVFASYTAGNILIGKQYLKTMTEIYKGKAIPLDRLRRLQILLRQIDYRMVGVISDLVAAEGARRHLKFTLGDSEKLWESIRDLLDTAQVKSEIESFEDEYRKFKSFSPKLEKAYGNSDIESVETLYDEWLDMKAVLFKAIDKMAEVQEQSMSEYYEDAKALASSANRVSIAISVIVIIISLLLGFLIVRSILLPINNIIKAAKAIAGGDRAYKIDIDSKDEIGQMAKELNRMLESLKAALQGQENKTKELKKSNEELREATAQLVQSEKLSSLGELTAGVAHELNQPLNVIKIICQTQLRDIEKNRFDKDEAKQDLPEIINQINRMAEIIDHMRVFSRRTEGEVKEIVDLSSAIENTFIFLGQQMTNHNIEVIKELYSDLPKIKGDGIRLEQVFMNLIANARHALEKSGKENKRIEIKTYVFEDQKSVAVEIKDNAEGIPEDLHEKIFQAFVTTKEKGKGTGLGLSISKKIIEEHRGRIELESRVGEGSTFRVVLPVADD